MSQWLSLENHRHLIQNLKQISGSSYLQHEIALQLPADFYYKYFMLGFDKQHLEESI